MAPDHGHESESPSAWSDLSDHELAVRAKQDPQLFGLLYDRYVDRIYRYCFRRLHTRQAAEDATSQTFLNALGGIASYRDDAPSFRAWLFAIARNIIIDVWRRAEPVTDLDQAIGVPAPVPGPDALMIAAEQQNELHDLITLLPDEQAHLIHLRLGGLSDREIADVLNRSYGAIRVAQHRALKQLKSLADTRTGQIWSEPPCE